MEARGERERHATLAGPLLGRPTATMRFRDAGHAMLLAVLLVLQCGARGASGAPLRGALECEELCKVSCVNSWRLLTACYEPSWGCPVGCARSCQEDGQKDTCEVACGVQFEGKRCDLASCQWGCRRGLQRDIKLEDIKS